MRFILCPLYTVFVTMFLMHILCEFCVWFWLCYVYLFVYYRNSAGSQNPCRTIDATPSLFRLGNYKIPLESFMGVAIDPADDLYFCKVIHPPLVTCQ